MENLGFLRGLIETTCMDVMLLSYGSETNVVAPFGHRSHTRDLTLEEMQTSLRLQLLPKPNTWHNASCQRSYERIHVSV